jgi:hypothetical protein
VRTGFYHLVALAFTIPSNEVGEHRPTLYSRKLEVNRKQREEKKIHNRNDKKSKEDKVCVTGRREDQYILVTFLAATSSTTSRNFAITEAE